MTLAANIARLLGENALSEATEEARGKVKSAPSDRTARHLYIDLLILAGEYEKADAQCNVASTLAPEDAVGFGLLRRELRGMAARRAWFEDGAVPTFPGVPTELDRLALALAVALREGEEAQARDGLAALEAARGERSLQWNGKAVPDFRDLDDRTPHALEAITSGGSYMWIDFSRIASLKIEPIARPRDLAFRRAELGLSDGASAPVLLPAIYHGTFGDPQLLLGRQTDWVEEPGGITTGRGQRCFLSGDELVTLHETAALGDPNATGRVAADG